MNDVTRETKGQARRKNSEWQEPATSPTRPNPNPGRPRNRWFVELERTSLFHVTYDETNKAKLGKIKKIKHPIKGRLPD